MNSSALTMQNLSRQEDVQSPINGSVTGPPGDIQERELYGAINAVLQDLEGPVISNITEEVSDHIAPEPDF